MNKLIDNTVTTQIITEITEKRELTSSTYVLRFDRKHMDFTAGQYITLGIHGDNETREYSIYSSTNDDFLEVLIKEVDDGILSKKLKRLQAGDKIRIEGPFGFFTLEHSMIANQKLLFLATGTGISPFHSIARSYANLNYTILHGVRHINEAYESEHYPADKYVSCVSGEDKGDFQGRITDYLRKNPIDKNTQVYLCGNCKMIYEAFDILTAQGLSPNQMHTEVYF